MSLADIQAMKALKLAKANAVIQSLLASGNVYSSSKKGYQTVTGDTADIKSTGFVQDSAAIFNTTYDSPSDTITVTHTSSLTAGETTVNEFFINNTDLQNILKVGNFNVKFDFSTQMTATNIYVRFYTVKGTSSIGTNIVLSDTFTLATNPVPGQTYSFNKTYDLSTLTVDTGNISGLRIYVKVVGYSAGSKVSTIKNYNVSYTPTVYSSVDREKAKADLINSLFPNPWKSKIWNAAGDSITAQGLWQPAVVSALGLSHKNYGVASTTVAVNNTYLTGQSFAERIPSMLDADLWTIFGGTNDWLYNTPIGTISDSPSTSQNTFYGGLKACVENILGRANYQKIILFTPLQSNRTSANTNGNVMTDFQTAIKNVGQYYSIPVLDFYAIGGINPFNLATLTSDGVHPNSTGAALISPKVIQAIQNLV